MAGIWYRTGTVALTNGSKRVTGTGTTWLDQAIGPVIGNTFWGPDNKPYEVERVVSNTALDLVEAYTGSTISSTPYKINTAEKFSVASLAGQVAATLQYAQAQYSNMSLWSSGDLPADVPVVLPDGISTKAVPNVTKILSLIAAKLTETAQLKALDVPSSGFGRARLADADAAAQRTALGLKKAAMVDILGTLVTPDAGGLMGAIMESGSNANGKYTKFASGLLICSQRSHLNGATPAGGEVTVPDWALPVSPTSRLSSDVVGTFYELADGNGYAIYTLGWDSNMLLPAGAVTQGFRRFLNTGVKTNSAIGGYVIGTTAANSIIWERVFIGTWY